MCMVWGRSRPTPRGVESATSICALSHLHPVRPAHQPPPIPTAPHTDTLRTVPSGRARAGRPDFGTVDRGTFRAMNALPEAMDSARRTGMRDRLAPKPLWQRPAARFCTAACDGLGEVKSGVPALPNEQPRSKLARDPQTMVRSFARWLVLFPPRNLSESELVGWVEEGCVIYSGIRLEQLLPPHLVVGHAVVGASAITTCATGKGGCWGAVGHGIVNFPPAISSHSRRS